MSLPRHPTTLPHRTIRPLARMVPPSLLLGAMLGAVVPGGAQEPETGGDAVASQGDAWTPPAGTMEAVREALSRRWGIPADSLVVEWARPRGEELRDGPVQVELLGSGRDGRWVAAVRSDGVRGEARSILLRAGVMATEPVALRTLERGETLREGDVGAAVAVRWGAPGTGEPTPRPGWVAQRRVQRGEALRSPALRPPLLVVSGQAVRAVWEGERVSITLGGTAVSSGTLGERVMVRTDTGQRLEGVVQGPGVVRVSSPTREIGR